MAKGIKLPSKAVNGRLVMLGEDPYIDQLISVALLDNESDNPFQDIGLGEWMLFDLNDELLESRLRERAKKAFEPLYRDQLCKFVALRIEREGAEARLFVDFENLETGDRRSSEVPLPDGIGS